MRTRKLSSKHPGRSIGINSSKLFVSIDYSEPSPLYIQIGNVATVSDIKEFSERCTIEEARRLADAIIAALPCASLRYDPPSGMSLSLPLYLYSITIQK